jgi:hypothetical protein
MTTGVFLIDQRVATVEIFLNERIVELRDTFVQLPLNVLLGRDHGVLLVNVSNQLTISPSKKKRAKTTSD